MRKFLAVLFVQLILLLVTASSGNKGNRLRVGTGKRSLCTTGKQYYDQEKGKCRKCPGCKKNLQFNITISKEYGALDCYPCYCKPGSKAFNDDTGRCDKCPTCNINGILNTSAIITINDRNGALDCYPCVCKPGYFAHELTDNQCVDCINCTQQNRQEISMCRPGSDAKCGDCLDGYKEDLNARSAACVRNITRGLTTTKTPAVTNQADHGPAIQRSEIITAADHGPALQRSEIITAVILILVTFICFVIIVACYRAINSHSCPFGQLNGTVLQSDNTISPGSSSNKSFVKQETAGSTQSATSALLGSSETEEDERNRNESEGGKQSTYIEESIQNEEAHVIIQIGHGNMVVVNSVAKLSS